jgi:hypothetical protein
VTPVNDALALAEQVLGDYDAAGAVQAPGPDLLWSDLLARALRELAAAVSLWHVTQLSDRPAALIRGASQAGDGAARPGVRGGGRVWGTLVRMVRARRGAGGVPEGGAVVLSASDAETVWQALVDAGAWHGVYGDCAVCVGEGICGERERHEVIAVRYAALRSWLGGQVR